MQSIRRGARAKNARGPELDRNRKHDATTKPAALPRRTPGPPHFAYDRTMRRIVSPYAESAGGTAARKYRVIWPRYYNIYYIYKTYNYKIVSYLRLLSGNG